MKTIYFLDFSYDEVIPLACDEDLFDEYEAACKRLNPEEVPEPFDSKTELLDFALENAHSARDGARKYEFVSREEMREMIKEVIEMAENEEKMEE